MEYLWLWFLCYAFIGWIYESILVSVQQRRWVNRGFLNGPLCPIYGAGAVLAIVLLSDVHNPVLIFIYSAIGACALEYGTSWLMEVLFHARWWDYSSMRFNLNGRICLIGAVIFGFGGVLVLMVIQPWLQWWTSMLSVGFVHWVSVISVLLVVADTVVTVAGIVHFEARLNALRDFIQNRAAQAGESWYWGRLAILDRFADLSAASQDRIRRLRRDIASMLSTQQRRMIRAFPHLKFPRTRDTSVLDTLREILSKRH